MGWPGAGMFGFSLKKIFRPRSAAADKGFCTGSLRKRSKGVSSETRVASYACTASPKKREKLYSRSVYSSAAGSASRALTTSGRAGLLVDLDELHRIPPLRVECLADERLVGGVQPTLRRTAQGAEHAVVAGDELQCEGTSREEPPAGQAMTPSPLAHQPVADLRERPPVGRHLEPVRRRADRLRGEARVLEPHLHLLGRALARGGAVEERVRVAVAERVHAVEHVLGPHVPEVAVVEDRVDHRGRVARLDAAHVAATPAQPDVEAVRIGTRIPALTEDRMVHTLRGHDVVRVGDDGRLAIPRVRELAQGKVLRPEGVVGALPVEVEVRVRRDRPVRPEDHPEETGAHLVLAPGVGAGAEVAGGARLHAVAAHLHVPEQRLPEDPGRLLITDIVAEIRGVEGPAPTRVPAPAPPIRRRPRWRSTSRVRPRRSDALDVPASFSSLPRVRSRGPPDACRRDATLFGARPRGVRSRRADEHDRGERARMLVLYARPELVRSRLAARGDRVEGARALSALRRALQD